MLSGVCGAMAAMIGAAVLYGWAVESQPIVYVVNGWVSMKPVTALMFVLIGVALVIIQTRWQTMAIVHAMLVGILVAISTAATMDAGGGLSSPFLDERLDSPLTIAPGVPAIGTLLAFAIASFGAVIGAIGNGPMRPVRRAAGIAVWMIGVASVVGYVTGCDVMYWSVPGVSSAMAIHASVGLILVGMSIFEMEPRKVVCGM